MDFIKPETEKFNRNIIYGKAGKICHFSYINCKLRKDSRKENKEPYDNHSLQNKRLLLKYEYGLKKKQNKLFHREKKNSRN